MDDLIIGFGFSFGLSFGGCGGGFVSFFLSIGSMVEGINLMLDSWSQDRLRCDDNG